MALELNSLSKAVLSLEAVLQRSHDDELMSSLDDITQYAIKAGVIQNFEFTYELCWKFIQRWIRENSTPEDADYPRTRKELFRMAARHGLLNDPLPWFAYSDARNITSHTYDNEKAELVYETATQFIHDAKYLLKMLEARND